MEYLNAFLCGGVLCLIGQVLIDRTRLTPARTPWLFLLECQKGRRPGLALQPDLVVQRPDGKYSPAMLEVYGKEAPL